MKRATIEKVREQEKEPAKPKAKKVSKARVIVSSDESEVFEESKHPKPSVEKKTKRSKPQFEIVIEKETPKESNKQDVEKKPKEKVAVSGSYRRRWGQTDREPPQHGMKPIPIGKENCLEGLAFVLTGLNESLTRDEMTSLISKYGGLERSAVSKKTNYLVAGFEMEDGRPITEGSKYRAAMEKGVSIITEDDLLKMIRDSNPEANQKKSVEKKVEEPKKERPKKPVEGDRTYSFSNAVM